ncbi:DUF302 domain-containing protein [Alkalibacillus haloalkaliphilus]|uniref:DUF302 domain-containing protein n=1 Tax=Alkalibacillus haloalkaliphilus TaxID=94136 RepID=A0A511W6H3_9BACI|nr:DUF302 domain-containing protein [Alkalibacillus haloalkaliphilus]GEN46686.1 hypothetical protein AHA02nite_24620 [Alkalibacillus haloalkaliphilus]
MFDYTVTTHKSVDEAVEALTQSLQEVKFGVLWDFDVKETLHQKGFDDFDQTYRILEVCNPKAAKDVLGMEEKVSYFLPCKVVVYESEGTTKIGMPKPTVLLSYIEKEEVTQFAQDIEETMVKAIDQAKS